MISGATGALAVVMVTLVANYGVQYLFATVILMGLIQIAFGLFKFGKFARIIPHPVMLGFVNGLAIVIGLAQFAQFKTQAGEWLPFEQLLSMEILICITMAIMYFLPKFTKAIPSALAGIEAIQGITKKYQDAGKQLHLLHLSQDCRTLLKNLENIITVNIAEDPKYKVASDKLAS